MRRIMISGGGTAGSVTPLLAIAGELRQRDPNLQLLFVGTRTGPEEALAEMANIPFRSLAAGKFRRYWSWSNLTDLAEIWRGFWAARRLVAEWQPDTIVTAGAAVSVPLVWAAKLAGCKILVHQLDVRPGLANRLMANAASVVTVTFESSVKHFPSNRTVYVGNPVRSEILSADPVQARAQFRLQPNLPTLLVLGGSTGSTFLNSLVGAVAFRLVRNWQIVHITGRERDFVELQDARYHRVDFLTWELPHVMAAADLVVCRAGLGTMTELAALGKPAVFIPLPETHQEENAAVLSRLKAGVVLAQNRVQPNDFYLLLEGLRKHPSETAQYGRNLNQLYRPDALNQLVDIILKLGK
jgi:UDP-N-acetylglucosamine--N-acetylmuramyl-(pentapeptide) pyrophosphoryl-undecaprenol N-acetylglucosamine transferase